jgi:hypothetical protein
MVDGLLTRHLDYTINLCGGMPPFQPLTFFASESKLIGDLLFGAGRQVARRL